MSEYDFQYREMKQAGADHSDPLRARQYDEKMQKFRDYEQEAQRIADLLEIRSDHTILDIGAGTGALTLGLSGHCEEITAIDVSAEMLKILQDKATGAQATNVRVHNAGMLTFPHPAKRFDRAIANAVLHHLPDFWKSVALKRVHDMLREGGLFYLNDVVFSFDIGDYEHSLNAFLRDLEMKTDSEFVEDGILHIREEFSTYDWILDPIIERAGFEIVWKNVKTDTMTEYILKA